MKENKREYRTIQNKSNYKEDGKKILLFIYILIKDDNNDVLTRKNISLDNESFKLC